MKKFLFKIFYFSVFVSLFALALQIILFIRINKKSIAHHDILDITSNVNADLVLMGSSRCWSHLDPAFFENQFNLKSVNIGVVGHSELSMVYARLQDYLKYNKTPKFVLLTLDPFVSEGSIDQPSKNAVNKNAFARYAFAPLNKDWETVKHFGFNNWEKYVPLYATFKYEQLHKTMFPNFSSLYVKYGYSKKDIQWDTIANPIDRNKKRSYFINQNLTKVKSMLIRINELCLSNNISLICIQTPVYESIYDQEVFKIPAIVAQECGIPFLDSNYEWIRTDIKYFQDSNHLNLDGVTALNQKLKEESILLDLLKNNETINNK